MPPEVDHVQTDAAHRLDYAAPTVKGGRRPYFRTGLFVFAAVGVFANLAFIALTTQQLHQAQWVHHDLMQNPRAYGREIDPATIASLRDWRPLAIAFCAFGIARR